jgi:ribose transport system ATP-binding protein
MLFHQEPVFKNISISILDRISRAAAEAGAASAHRQPARSSSLQIRPPLVGLDSACSPAATSRRSRWRNG